MILDALAGSPPANRWRDNGQITSPVHGTAASTKASYPAVRTR